ncbi:glycosyltransferase family 2 protein [Roseomonas sp. BN140053]|uniref:glycosyltransferase family 2 protein n=1 Tax=Roseomonas sp. BN140053 TaxID=3391898 RepID=UPI0039E98680
MATFRTQAEIRDLGAPVVRLFRTALGRDPIPAELDAAVSRLRDGAEPGALAAELAAGEEFRRLHGPDAPPDDAFVARLQRHALGDAARPDGRALLLAAAAMGAGRAALLAAVAQSPEARAALPLLPGLVPGAPPDDPQAYRLWVEEYDSPTAAELARVPPIAGPRVTVAVVAGDTDAEGALRTVKSLQRQVYGDWNAVLVTRFLSAWPRDALARLAATEPRLRLLEAGPGTPRAEAWNRALAAGDGELCCLLQAGDRLAPTALHEVVAELAAHPAVQLLFTDEDVLEGEERRAPRFKPGFSPDALLAGDAIGQLAVFRAGLLRDLGGPRAEAAPREFYDLTLRAAALAGPGGLRHLPAVLCHRAAPGRDWPAPPDAPPREAPGLAVMLPGPPLATEAGIGALPWPHARFRLPEPPPTVSVIIPTKDRPELLAACTAGLLERTDYPALELLVVDNGSTDPAARELLARLEARPGVRVLRRPGPFNFAALNNAAATEAGGEVLLLLNNDTEVLHPDWLREMASHALRPDVGAVGAKLLYPDGTVQHAGILLGPEGAATHVGRGAAAAAPGYDGQLACTRDLSAVTGACLALRRDVFRAVGGMDERLAVTWNDVDLCLRVRAAGLRVVWTPHAALLHRESVSRGLEAANREKQERFRAEQALVRERWGEALDRDPFLNPNLLASEAGPLVLGRPRRRRPWQGGSVA